MFANNVNNAQFVPHYWSMNLSVTIDTIEQIEHIFTLLLKIVSKCSLFSFEGFPDVSHSTTNWQGDISVVSN